MIEPSAVLPHEIEQAIADLFTEAYAYGEAVGRNPKRYTVARAQVADQARGRLEQLITAALAKRDAEIQRLAEANMLD